MQKFTHLTYLKKTILMMIAYHSNSREDSQKYRKLFINLDSQKQGFVDLEDLEKLLGSTLSKEEIKKMFHSMDLDQNGKVYWSEFLSATISQTVFL